MQHHAPIGRVRRHEGRDRHGQDGIGDIGRSLGAWCSLVGSSAVGHAVQGGGEAMMIARGKLNVVAPFLVQAGMVQVEQGGAEITAMDIVWMAFPSV